MTRPMRPLDALSLVRHLRPVWLLALLAVLVPALSACSVADRIFNPTDPCTDDLFAFADAFDEPGACGWTVYQGAGAASEIEDGVLRLTVGSNGQLAWANTGRSFGDVVINVDAAPVSGPADNAYGIVCRYLNPQNFYVFVISSDGFYAVGKYSDASPEIEYLTGEAPLHYVPSDAINTGLSGNQIEARCVADQLSLFANGELLVVVEDGTHRAGDIGVAAGSFDMGTVVVEFDNFTVQTP